MNEWYFPITILPAIGFFIVAATSISNSLSAETSRLIELERGNQTRVIQQKIRQFSLVNWALILLYISAVLMAVAGLIGGLIDNMVLQVAQLVYIFVCLGIGFMVIALLLQCIFAIRSASIKRHQLDSKLLHLKQKQQS